MRFFNLIVNEEFIMIDLKRQNFDELSDIKLEIYTGESRYKDYLEIMVLKYNGIYGIGSSGNGDAQYMYAMGKAALAAWEPSGVILDWSNLDYQWGDMLEMVLDIGEHQYIDAMFPTAVIVGPKCEEAVRTLLLGIDSKEPIEKLPFVFRDLESAWQYINKLLEENN
jgi:hypothetical protein